MDSVVLEELEESDDSSTRCLLMVTRAMEFLPEGTGAPISSDIPFPVAVIANGENLTIHVLTMQITMERWGEIVGKKLRHILTAVHADKLHDKALNFLTQSGVPIGKYVDCSAPAAKLMKRADINTYSGTLEITTVGETRHSTVRGKGKKSLRSSMPDEFQKLLAAKRLVNAEIELADDYLGLQAESRIALYPTVGKLAFRSNLQGSDPDEFVKSLVV